MLSPADLVEMAETFAGRIPADAEYHEERDTSWQLIGEAYLRLNDPDSARRTLTRFHDVEVEVELRCTFAKWAAEHPHSDTGRAVLRETVGELNRLEPKLGLGDYEKLVPIVTAMLGNDAAQPIRDLIGDPIEVEVGDLLARAAELSSRFPTREFPPEPGIDRLRRYLRYRHNDLKVRWLVEQALAGGLDHADTEQLLASDDFCRLEKARQPGQYADPSSLTFEAFAGFFFNRAVPSDPRDERVLAGRHFSYSEPNEARILELSTRLFENFVDATRGYTARQIDQGLWILLGLLLKILPHADLPEGTRRECVAAMVHPFRDYLRKKPRYPGSAFFMWWDLIRLGETPLKPDALAVLQQILGMPGWPCQQAALHGLNHLRPDPDASRLIATYLAANATRLKPKDREWVELCRDGKAL